MVTTANRLLDGVYRTVNRLTQWGESHPRTTAAGYFLAPAFVLVLDPGWAAALLAGVVVMAATWMLLAAVDEQRALTLSYSIGTAAGAVALNRLVIPAGTPADLIVETPVYAYASYVLFGSLVGVVLSTVVGAAFTVAEWADSPVQAGVSGE